MSAPGPQLSIASTFVLGDMEPLRLVIHHADGSWDFLCDTTDDARFLTTVRAEHVFEQFPTDLAALRSLPPGLLTERGSASDVWSTEPFGDDE
ncbi:hypothetical protein [Geodermatophilus chilensis]|uniref:hypothetical protein n=1 Tax=Geodermatophilus chilensis TaxID=2035835 RepID=UPI000C268362|nr:hypothetical protein [Geodermatophilus chilensis]